MCVSAVSLTVELCKSLTETFEMLHKAFNDKVFNYVQCLHGNNFHLHVLYCMDYKAVIHQMWHLYTDWEYHIKHTDCFLLCESPWLNRRREGIHNSNDWNYDVTTTCGIMYGNTPPLCYLENSIFAK